MRRLLTALILAGGAVALPACGPSELDVGVGPAYPVYGYGYYDGYYPYYGGYYGHRGYYGHPHYNRGVVVGRGWGDHERHEAFEHRGSAIQARPAPPMARPAAPMARPAAPMGRPMASPPPAHHR